MKLLLAAAALMAGVSAKPGTVRINKAKGTFIASFVLVVVLCNRSVRTNRFSRVEEIATSFAMHLHALNIYLGGEEGYQTNANV